MGSSQKLIGIVIIVAFTLMAGSVICFASGPATLMGNCGNGMTPGAMCPSMSVSVQAVASASSSTARLLGLVAMLVFAAGFIFRGFVGDVHAKKLFVIARERTGDLSIGRRSDPVLNLISSGILHSRVFSC